LAKQKKTKQKIDPSIWVILIGGLMLLVAVIVLFTQSRQSTPTTAGTQNPNIPYPQVVRVSVQDAKVAFDAGTVVFVDVRGADLYNAGHIPGALEIAEDEIESRLSELNPSDSIITYCT